MHPSQLKIKDYTYNLPDEKIAQYPLPERDSSKLLVYKNGNIEESIYRQLDEHLPENALLVFNETKVIHARLIFQKETGAKIEIFCLEPDERYADVQKAMLQNGEVFWKCMVGGAAKWKDGQSLYLADVNTKGDLKALQMCVQIAERREGYFVLKIQWNPALSFAEALHLAGKVPLPPYMNREADKNDESRYQTMFAHNEGSVAAPTAALHFTDSIIEKLNAKHISTGFVTLHVGAGTFKPVKSETMESHDMHSEWLDVSPELLQQVIEHLKLSRPIVAVGTTSARTLESLYWIGVRIKRNDIVSLEGIVIPQWYPYDNDSNITALDAFESLLHYLQQNEINKLVTRTQIIIAPGYKFRIIQGLITNFHQPQSTLLLLVSALVGKAWREIYDYALLHDFRFLSYGDGCLLWC